MAVKSINDSEEARIIRESPIKRDYSNVLSNINALDNEIYNSIKRESDKRKRVIPDNTKLKCTGNGSKIKVKSKKIGRK